MGFITIILVVVTILVIIGLGWQTFLKGIFNGAQKIINSSPELRNLTGEAKSYITNITENSTKNLLNDLLNK
ncbi:MAG: hypothetical protein WB511_08955 [Nitrososphaeraceae archaeon]|jgi:hypothetical protein